MLPKGHTLESFRLLNRNDPLTPSPKDEEFGPNQSVTHDLCSMQPARIPVPIRGPRLGDIGVNGHPGASEDGDQATPNDVQDRPALAQVCARQRRGTVVEDHARGRGCEDSFEDVDEGENDQHDSAACVSCSEEFCPIICSLLGAQRAVQRLRDCNGFSHAVAVLGRSTVGRSCTWFDLTV